MAKSQDHGETESPMSDGEKIAALDAVYVRVVAGIPVPVSPPFGEDHEFTARDRQILNWAHATRAASVLNSALTRGKQKDYTDADKLAYARAYLNGGGTVAGAKVESYSFSDDLGSDMSLLEESIDRVRWDGLVSTGKFSGDYSDHNSAKDIAERAKARAAIRSNFDAVPGPAVGAESWHGGRSYGALVLAKADEVLSARYATKTRTAKAAAEDLGI